MKTAVEASQVSEAVFSVCAPAEFVAGAMAAVESVSGATFAGEFQEYITGTRQPQFPALFKNAQLCIALIDCDANPEAALETMDRLQQLLPLKTRMIGISSSLDAGLLVRAMRAGCNEFLSKPLVAKELIAALRRFQATSPLEGTSVAQTGKAIAFVGSKGGVGTTTLAIHLAVHLVRTHKKRVLLVDQKHQLGHVAIYLGIKETKYHFSELLQNVTRLDAHLLEKLTTHHPGGVDVIASPEMCSPRYEAKAEDAISVISFLRQRYDYVLIDSESESTEWLASLATCCDEVDMVCTPDVASLRDLSRHIERLTLTADAFVSKLRIIVNRYGLEPAVSKNDIERAVRCPIAFDVPDNYIDLVKAINAGEPIVPGSKGKFTQAIAKWAHALVGVTEDAVGVPLGKKGLRFWG